MRLSFGHGDPFRFYIAQEEVPPHLAATDMIVRIPQGPWPSVALAPPGRYDALKFIDNAESRQSVYQNWDDDVLRSQASSSLYLDCVPLHAVARDWQFPLDLFPWQVYAPLSGIRRF